MDDFLIDPLIDDDSSLCNTTCRESFDLHKEVRLLYSSVTLKAVKFRDRTRIRAYFSSLNICSDGSAILSINSF